VKKRKGHLQVEIDPKIYKKLKKVAKEKGKSVDELASEVFLKTMKTKKRIRK
jgi:predicted HicB family RNase H-like nuclease